MSSPNNVLPGGQADDSAPLDEVAQDDDVQDGRLVVQDEVNDKVDWKEARQKYEWGKAWMERLKFKAMLGTKEEAFAKANNAGDDSEVNETEENRQLEVARAVADVQDQADLVQGRLGNRKWIVERCEGRILERWLDDRLQLQGGLDWKDWKEARQKYELNKAMLETKEEAFAKANNAGDDSEVNETEENRQLEVARAIADVQGQADLVQGRLWIVERRAGRILTPRLYDRHRELRADAHLRSENSSSSGDDKRQIYEQQFDSTELGEYIETCDRVEEFRKKEQEKELLEGAVNVPESEVIDDDAVVESEDTYECLSSTEVDHLEKEDQEMEHEKLCTMPKYIRDAVYDVLNTAGVLEEPEDGNITRAYYTALYSLSPAERYELSKKHNMSLDRPGFSAWLEPTRVRSVDEDVSGSEEQAGHEDVSGSEEQAGHEMDVSSSDKEKLLLKLTRVRNKAGESQWFRSGSVKECSSPEETEAAEESEADEELEREDSVERMCDRIMNKELIKGFEEPIKSSYHEEPIEISDDEEPIENSDVVRISSYPGCYNEV